MGMALCFLNERHAVTLKYPIKKRQEFFVFFYLQTCIKQHEKLQNTLFCRFNDYFPTQSFVWKLNEVRVYSNFW